MKIVPASILTAYDSPAIGTRIDEARIFSDALAEAVSGHRFEDDVPVPGQAVIELWSPEALRSVSCGVGRRSADPADYVLRAWRGRVEAFLRRELAAPAVRLRVVVYTAAAYLADPDVRNDSAEVRRIKAAEATHVLVAVLADADFSEAPPTPYRLVANLAGGNSAAFTWSADAIRAIARASIDCDALWAVVAD
jgi:hypothetical protein